MKKHLLFCAAVMAIAALLASGTGVLAADAKDAAATDDKSASADAGKTLFEENCAKCHKLEKTTNYKGKENWDSIVKRMAKKKNVKINDDAAAKITAYLNKTYPQKPAEK